MLGAMIGKTTYQNVWLGFAPKSLAASSKDLSNLFTGPTAVAFGEDAIMSARILSKFAKDNENLKLIGGMMDNEVLDQAGVLNVANLPTLDEARANIVGILNASASKLVSILLARSEKMSSLPPENSETQPKE